MDPLSRRRRERTYKEIFHDTVHKHATLTAEKICELCGFPPAYFRKVMNPNDPSRVPAEWIPALTMVTGNSDLVEQMSRDCKGLHLPEHVIAHLAGKDWEEFLKPLRKFLKYVIRQAGEDEEVE